VPGQFLEAGSCRYPVAMRAKRLAVGLVVILLPGLMLAPVWRLGGLGAGEDDVLYYYPSRAFFRDTVLSGNWPWLYPWNGLDRPFAADPQAAVWYPFTLLFVALPAGWAYPAALWVHYSLALLGAYRLFRAAGLSRVSAVFGAIVFAFCGFMLAHRAHFSMQQAAAWTPWVFWRLQRCVEKGAGVDGRRLVAAWLVAGLQCFAGHVQIALLTALGSLVWLMAAQRGQAGRVLLRWGLAWLGAAGLFAVQWLPTADYLRLCTRLERGYWDFVENSFYPWSAIGWLIPMFFGQRRPNFFDQPYWGPSHQCEQFSYAGVIPLLLAAACIRAGWKADARRRGWVAVGATGLLVGLGTFAPVCPVLYLVPGANLFRVPARALLLFDLAVAALAALALEELQRPHSPRRVRLRAVLQRWGEHPVKTTVILLAVLLVPVLAVTPLLAAESRQAALLALRPWRPAVAAAGATIFVALFVLGLAARRWRQPRWSWLAVIVTAADLGVMGWTVDVPAGVQSPQELLPSDAEPWIRQVRESGTRLWVVTDTAGLYRDPVARYAGRINALVGLRALADYGPLQPKLLQERFAFTPWGASGRAAALLEETGWMRAFNVGWVLLCGSDFPAPAGCEPVGRTAGGFDLYRNPTACGMAFFESAVQPGAVAYIEKGPNQFVTRVDTWWPGPVPKDQPARLIVSRLALPGWRAECESRQIPVEVASGGLLAVQIQPQRAIQIEWSYFPPGLLEGAAITAAVLAISAWLLVSGTTGASGGYQAAGQQSRKVQPRSGLARA
jgi:hypothetical protein